MAVGAVTGAVAGDIYEHVKDSAGDIAGVNKPEHGPIELHMLVDLVAEIHKIIRDANQVYGPAVMRKAYLTTGNPYTLYRNGYKHVSMLATSSMTINVQTEIGQIAFAINAGWNAFDLPDNVQLTLSSGGPNNVILRWGDDSLDIAGV